MPELHLRFIVMVLSPSGRVFLLEGLKQRQSTCYASSAIFISIFEKHKSHLYQSIPQNFIHFIRTNVFWRQSIILLLTTRIRLSFFIDVWQLYFWFYWHLLVLMSMKSNKYQSINENRLCLIRTNVLLKC